MDLKAKITELLHNNRATVAEVTPEVMANRIMEAVEHAKPDDEDGPTCRKCHSQMYKKWSCDCGNSEDY